MPFSIQFGAAPPRQLTPSGDLANKLLPDLSALFQLDRSLEQSSGKTLSDAPAAALQTAFRTNREAAWKLGAEKLTLSFKPSATGSIKIVKSGELFNYTLGSDANKKKVSIPVHPGNAYVVITLRVSLSVAGGAAYSAGNLGVSGNISDSDEFDISNYKCFDSSELLARAITAAFEHFVLPFKDEGIDNLNHGDYIDFEFIGKLNLGFGVNSGLSGLKLGGRSAGEVAASFSNNPLGKSITRAVPTYELGDAFSVAYDHEDAFRVVVGRRGRTGSAVNGASLDLFRSAQRKLSTKFTAGITVAEGANFDAAGYLNKALGKAASTATAALPPDIREAVSTTLLEKLRQPGGFAADIAKKVDGLLEKADGQKAGLQIEQEKAHNDTALFHFDFNFNHLGALNKGFDAAMRGRYSDAIRIPGVTLAPDSYVESVFLLRTSLTLEFFDLWKFTDATTYTQQTGAIYAGNGIFRLRARTGVATESGVVGHTGQCEMYFTAEARHPNVAETVADLAVKLNFALIDTKNAKSAGQTLCALDLLHAAALGDKVAQMRRTLTAESVARVTCVFDEAANLRIRFDPPQSRLAPNDHRNYSAFAGAVMALDPTAPPLFASYDHWAVFNVTSWDKDGSTNPPDRTQTGGSGWPSSFPNLDNLGRARVGCYFEAGRHFMNLCAHLKQLCGDIDATATEAQYAHLLDGLNGIVRQDAPVFFLKPALIALLEASGTKPVNATLSGTDLSFTASA